MLRNCSAAKTSSKLYHTDTTFHLNTFSSTPPPLPSPICRRHPRPLACSGEPANPLKLSSRASSAVASGHRVCTCNITPRLAANTVQEHAHTKSRNQAWASEIPSPSKFGNSHNEFQHLTAATEGISSTVNAGFTSTKRW